MHLELRLPIDLESITNLQEAKNAIELLLNLYLKQQEEIQLLKGEIARIKGQSKKPQFNSARQREFGVSKLLKVDKKWNICSCGSNFKSLIAYSLLF